LTVQNVDNRLAISTANTSVYIRIYSCVSWVYEKNQSDSRR